MRLAELPNNRIILILGAPRSGTSWLGKAFDSHPDVVLRHEPDTVLRECRLPGICLPSDIDTHVDLARNYLQRLMDVRTLKTSGQLPLYPKSYQGTAARYLRTGMVLGLHVAEKALGLRNALRGVHIPDAVTRGDLSRVHLVMKSVSSLGRARLFASALPGARIIHLVRSPFGQVASMIRGIAQNRFEDTDPVEEILQTRLAAPYGLTREKLLAMPLSEQLAWHWSLMNQIAIEDLAGVPGVQTVRYMDMVLDPQRQIQDIFARCDLGWHEQTTRFLNSSTSFAGPDLYYQVYRNGAEPLFKWRQELARDDIGRILNVVKSTPVSQLYPELDGWAATA
jgi:hypothetical protein